MALSLVGDYAGSSSEASEEESEEEQRKPTKPAISLPSAADLFDSVDTSSASFLSPPEASADVPLITPKRKTADGGSGSGTSSSNKKSQDVRGAAVGSGGGGATAGSNRGMIPPQMSRPNIVTEDSALWSSDASRKRQRQGEAERRGAASTAATAAEGGKGKKGGKDSLTFKQREKAKRDKGQASRGKSYVEEEKRLLRELGSS